ncbi:hypothetical protein SLH49_11025 [Cognatiyoonia sp. IB215446]|uniref:hypothetical protein n=1 Tax=Cognatiyoonia sp. IB215446 TaxID=3097355 RepID=UPI002A0D6749|nr:hypothetical protein [Cognatiyoonia sp. IB215446]MDX8348520.1 hypothetical protein [Cognatiyoonia sp. IB215446]
MEFALVNWLAVGVGTIGAFVLGMVWFSPVMVGKGWATGSHNIQFNRPTRRRWRRW